MPVKASSNPKQSRRLALIAGMGELPKLVSHEATNKGYTVIGVALQPPADETLRNCVHTFHTVRIGQFGRLLSLLKKSAVSDIVLAGKVPKSLLFSDKRSLIPDTRALKLLFSIKDRSDDTIMKAIVQELQKEGFTIHNTTAFTKSHLAPEEVLTRKKPTKREWRDIEFGWKIAKKMGRLDIGQTVVIKDKAVLAIEAIEGTDAAIERGGRLADKDAVVVKVSKPGQDMRFDVPVVGSSTLNTMIKANARVLAIEAGKTIILNLRAFIREADRAGLVVAGVKNA